MAHPLVAVCQMTSTNDKEKNLQTVRELAEKAKSRTACVSTYNKTLISFFKYYLYLYKFLL